MGLDMYLTQKFYVKNWDHMKDEEKHEISILRGGVPSGIPTERICYIETEEIYWRKANAIHKWFVDNVQDGVDECQDSYVSRENLEDLLSAVTEVLDGSDLVDGDVVNGYSGGTDGNGGFIEIPNIEKGKTIKDTSVAERILPAGGGFFFGSTDYDQWYYEDLERTKRELERILSEPDIGTFYYHSSW